MQSSHLIYLLNQQLNREVSMLLCYMAEAAAIKGTEQEIVRTTYLRRVSEKIEHAQSLADQIFTLRGTPNLHPVRARPPASLRERLRHDADEEAADVQNYLRLASQAGKNKLAELKQMLETRATDAHQHGYEMRCLLW